MRNVVILLIGLMAILAACTTSMDDGHMMDSDVMTDDAMIESDKMMEDNVMESDKMMEDDVMESDKMMKDDVMEHDAMMDDAMMESDKMMENSMMESSYQGEILAGSETKYIAFNQADYEMALASGKTIFLDFYATWCPVCVSEQAEVRAAFDELELENVVGFRVNYNDDDTDADEKALAKEFNIVYQHTKVIIKDGEQTLKDLQAWNKQKVIDELSN